MNKLFHIPKMKIVVVSAAVMVLLAIITVTVVCLNVEQNDNTEEGGDITDVMADPQESEPDESLTQESEATVTEPVTEGIPYDEKGLLYQNNGNGTCTIVGIGTCVETNIEIPETSPDGLKVVAISTGAFENCPKIELVSIPSTVKTIGTGAFVGCVSLSSISVDSTNTEFCSVGSVLFSKDKTELICYPAKRVGVSYLLSTNVTKLAPYAFDSVSTLSKLLYRGTIDQFQRIQIGIGNSIFNKMPIEFNYNGAK